MSEEMLPLVAEVRRSHAEAAELRSHVEALDVALRASGERREVAERENAELRAQVEILKTHLDNYAEVIGSRQQENAELRKERDDFAVGLREEDKKHKREMQEIRDQYCQVANESAELREMLQKVSSCAPEYPETGRYYLVPEFLFRKLRAVLSPKQADQEEDK